MNPRQDWTREEKELLISLLDSGKYKYADMVPFFPTRSMYSIIGQTGYLKLHNNKFTNQLYFYNEKYFSEYTLENCYYAGVFMADASISSKGKRRGTGFVWSVSEKDEQMIKLFCNKINYTGPIKKSAVTCTISTKDVAKKFTQFRMCIYNCKWANDLATKFGITEDKTYRNVPQNFPSLDHELAFLIGLIDGDGVITRGKNDNTTFTISLCSCSLPTIEWFKKITTKLNLPSLSWRENKIFKPDDENCYYYSIRGCEAAFLFELLKSIPVPKLDRKWNNPDILECVENCKKRYYNSSKKDPKKAKLEIQVENLQP